MTFTPTPEQLAIVSAARETDDNLLINALAGAAKTSTLVLIAEALPTTQILCLAFNKKIANEMTERLPSNCTAMTLNSLGHRVWGQTLGKRLRIEPSKIYDLFSSYLSEMTPDEKSETYESLSDMMNAVRFAKSCGVIPFGYRYKVFPPMKGLMTVEDFFAHYDEKFEPWQEDLIARAIRESLDLAWQGLCDYDDQILLPTLGMGAFPSYPLILVDEAQDLSALNHAMLRKLVKKRLIAVGDPCQAIYGFRGAHEDSMSLMQKTFSMKELGLSISFRCPTSVVKEAQWRAPHMRAPEWAKEGEVRTLTKWTSDDLPDYAAIICRNNAPLFSMAIKLLKAGRYPELFGNDIGKGLLKIMKKFGPSSLPQENCFEALASWTEERKMKVKNVGVVEDQAACIHVFLSEGKDLGEAIAFAEHVFAASGPLKLMTGHKSKGLEFENVFILDQFMIGKEGQDRNLRYVMQTRAKSTLTYIRTEDYS